MMSVFEYAEDMNKTVGEILKKCKDLGIDAYEEEDMLDDEAITLLDNVFANEQIENGIVFKCDTVPTSNVEFYVKWEDITWI